MNVKSCATAERCHDNACRTGLNDVFTQLRAHLTSIVNNATFNGLNSVKNGGNDIFAILEDTATSALTIAAQDLSLSGSIVSLTASSEIDTQSKAAVIVTDLETSIKGVNAALSKLGAGAKRLEMQDRKSTRLNYSP